MTDEKVLDDLENQINDTESRLRDLESRRNIKRRGQCLEMALQNNFDRKFDVVTERAQKFYDWVMEGVTIGQQNCRLDCLEWATISQYKDSKPVEVVLSKAQGYYDFIGLEKKDAPSS